MCYPPIYTFLSQTAFPYVSNKGLKCTISNIRCNINLLFSENIGNHACREQKLMGPVPYLETRLRFSPVGETA
jgi:hypothetical protein